MGIEPSGLSLPAAAFIPEFLRQAYATGLFHDVQQTHLTPLDDLKNWMRSDPWRAGELFGQVGEALLGEERAAQKKAEKAGLVFDLTAFEIEQMEGDETYETFTPVWTAEIFKLALDEGDALLEWSLRELKVPFALAASFTLPDPKRHPRFKASDLAATIAGQKTGKISSMDMQGAFQLDLCSPGVSPRFDTGQGVAFAGVQLVDPRAGDTSQAWLSMAYPLANEAYFKVTFEAMRKALALKAD